MDKLVILLTKLSSKNLFAYEQNDVPKAEEFIISPKIKASICLLVNILSDS